MEKGIYVIKNRLANAMVSDVFTCETDSMAIVGFSKFLEKQPLDKSCYTLYRLGFFDVDKLTQRDTFSTVVCFGHNAEKEVANIIAEMEAD